MGMCQNHYGWRACARAWGSESTARDFSSAWTGCRTLTYQRWMQGRQCAVQCGAVRCGAVRCGAVRCGAVRALKLILWGGCGPPQDNEVWRGTGAGLACVGRCGCGPVPAQISTRHHLQIRGSVRKMDIH